MMPKIFYVVCAVLLSVNAPDNLGERLTDHGVNSVVNQTPLQSLRDSAFIAWQSFMSNDKNFAADTMHHCRYTHDKYMVRKLKKDNEDVLQKVYLNGRSKLLHFAIFFDWLVYKVFDGGGSVKERLYYGADKPFLYTNAIVECVQSICVDSDSNSTRMEVIPPKALQPAKYAYNATDDIHNR